MRNLHQQVSKQVHVTVAVLMRTLFAQPDHGAVQRQPTGIAR